MNKNIFLKGLKTIPILMGLFLMFYLAIGWRGYFNMTPINNIAGTSLITSIILYTASVQLNYCQTHRCFIIYDSIASLWVDIKKIVGPIVGMPINFIIVLIGIILFIWLLILLVKQRKKPGH